MFEEVEGVVDVESGYTGGSVAQPTYRQVCEGTTGHAEVVRSNSIRRDQLSRTARNFFSIHDPTTLNRQGNDVGTQYRSAIYVHSAEQRSVAEDVIREAQRTIKNRIVTEVTEAGRVLASRGLSPGVLPTQSGAGLLHVRRCAQGREVQEDVCGKTKEIGWGLAAIRDVAVRRSLPSWSSPGRMGNAVRKCSLRSVPHCSSGLVSAQDVGKPAPAFDLPAAGAQNVRLAELKGRVVYVDFWASWCAPCKQSFPWMNDMQAKYGPRD